MTIQLATIDYLILFTYFVVVLAVGWWISHHDKHMSADGFFVGGRQVGWFAIGASLFASNISSEHLIGLSADGFRTGLAVGNYEWGACVVLVLLAFLFVPFYISSGIRTLPEFLEKRFGLAARMYLSGMTLVMCVLVRLSVALYAGALVLQEFFGVPFWGAVLVLAITTVVYTAMGGLRAVIYTDVVQTVILLIGTAALTVIALTKVGGWSSLTAQLDASFFEMVRPASDKEMPWPGLLLGVPVLGIWYWCTDQVIVQRVLAAKSVTEARRGALFAAALKILPVFLFVLPGLCARVLYPEIDSKSAFPMLIAQLLPAGLTGLVAAALIAALMSSIDSTLNSAGALFSLDFYERFRPSASPEELVRVGRITTVVVSVFGIAWVSVVASAESLFQYLQQVNAAISPPIAATFLLGVLSRRVNHTGVMVGLVSGLVIGLGLLAFSDINFLIGAGINFGICVLIIVAASLLSEVPARAKVEGLTLGTLRPTSA